MTKLWRTIHIHTALSKWHTKQKYKIKYALELTQKKIYEINHIVICHNYNNSTIWGQTVKPTNILTKIETGSPQIRCQIASDALNNIMGAPFYALGTLIPKPHKKKRDSVSSLDRKNITGN